MLSYNGLGRCPDALLPAAHLVVSAYVGTQQCILGNFTLKKHSPVLVICGNHRSGEKSIYFLFLGQGQQASQDIQVMTHKAVPVKEVNLYSMNLHYGWQQAETYNITCFWTL